MMMYCSVCVNLEVIFNAIILVLLNITAESVSMLYMCYGCQW